ncbi:hypothetical protein VTO42DRAFT_8365 [Malbranchea cinnamomea]
MDEPESVLHLILQAFGQFFSELSVGGIAALLVVTCLFTRFFSGINSHFTRRSRRDRAWSPRAIPHWVPFIGHGVSLGLLRQWLLEKARANINEPVFALKILGRTHHMVTSPSMAKALLEEKSSTSMESFLDHVMENAFGASKKMRKYNRLDLYTTSGSTNFITQEPHVSTLSSNIVNAIRQSMPNLVSFSPSVVDQYPWERTGAISVNNESNPPTCDVNFYALIRHYVGHITTTALMGQAFVDVIPSFVPDLWVFDTRFNAMVIGISRFFPGPGLIPAYSARLRLIQSLTAFHNAFVTTEAGNDPGIHWRDLDDVSEFIQARCRALIKSGISAESAASENLFVLWATNIKLATITYWNLVHILADDDLHAEVMKEIAPHVQASRPDSRASGFNIQEPPRLSLNLDRLLTSCSLLKSTIYETLRLYTSSFTYRKLTEKLTLTESEEDANLAKRDRHPYQFHVGEYVAVPQFLLNSDANRFQKPEEFDHRRYLQERSEGKASDGTDFSSKDEKKPQFSSQFDLPELEGILPFAGRDPECNVEEFATRVAMAFTAAILAMWDIEPADSGPWEIPKKRLGSLVFKPKTEIRVKMKLRI